MEFIELADYVLPAGRVVGWLPTAGTHWADWPRDSRAVSFNHEHHLRSALQHPEVRETGRSWLGQAFNFDQPFDALAWTIAVEAWIDRHEVMRSHVAIEGDRATRYTLPRGAVRIRGRETGTSCSTLSSYRLVQRLLDESTVPLRWPSYQFVTVEHKYGFTVVFGADHSLMDGYSAVLVAGELHALYEAATTGSECALAEVGSYVDFGDQERTDTRAITATDPPIGLWREFFASAAPDHNDPTDGSLPRTFVTGLSTFPIDFAPEAITQAPRMSQRTLAMHMLDDRQAEAIARSAHQLGQGLFAALLGGFATVANDLTGARHFRTVVPQHTRTELKWANAVGWFVGLSPFQLDTSEATGLGQLIEASGRELRRCRAAAAVPFAYVCDLVGVQPRISFVVSYMDIRSVPTAERSAEWNAHCLRSRNDSPTEFYFWFARGPQGVSLNMRYPGTTQATREVHQLSLGLRALLVDLAEHGVVRSQAPEGAEFAW